MFKWISFNARLVYLHVIFLWVLIEIFILASVVKPFKEVYEGFGNGKGFSPNLKFLFFVNENLQWLNHLWALIAIPPILYAISVYLYKRGWVNKWTEVIIIMILGFTLGFIFVTLFTPQIGLSSVPNK